MARTEPIFRGLANGEHTGWQLVRHSSGQPCFVHLKSRVCIWTQPYKVPNEEALEAHKPPPDIIHSLERKLPEAKRVRRASPPTLDTTALQPGPSVHAGHRDAHVELTALSEMSLAARARAAETAVAEAAVSGRTRKLPLVYETLGDISSKTPMELLNELCPKLLKCVPVHVQDLTDHEHGSNVDDSPVHVHVSPGHVHDSHAHAHASPMHVHASYVHASLHLGTRPPSPVHVHPPRSQVHTGVCRDHAYADQGALESSLPVPGRRCPILFETSCSFDSL
jgi:hypothetical protein